MSFSLPTEIDLAENAESKEEDLPQVVFSYGADRRFGILLRDNKYRYLYEVSIPENGYLVLDCTAKLIDQRALSEADKTQDGMPNSGISLVDIVRTEYGIIMSLLAYIPISAEETEFWIKKDLTGICQAIIKYFERYHEILDDVETFIENQSD